MEVRAALTSVEVRAALTFVEVRAALTPVEVRAEAGDIYARTILKIGLLESLLCIDRSQSSDPADTG